MTTQKVIEKMPKAVKEAIGNAQKKLTHLEGEARKAFKDTYSKFMKNSSVKKMEKSIDDWRTLYSDKLDLSPIYKKVDKVRTDISNKAFDSVGIATKTDIKNITRKINNLRAELNKIGGGRKPSSAARA